MLSSSDSFERAKDKLKRAEMVTDVNTDLDELHAKKQRRVTAAKRYSTDESEETDTFAGSLPVFPRQPIVQQRSCENDLSFAYCSKRNASCKKIIFILMLPFFLFNYNWL